VDVNSEIAEFVKHSVNEVWRSSKLKNQLERLTTYIGQKIPCTSCGGEIKRAFRELQKFHRSGKKVLTAEEKNKIRMSQFELKGLTYIREPFFEHFSNKNITDEKAIEILKSNPKRSALFSKLPDNWMDLVNGVEPENIFKPEPKEPESKKPAKKDKVKPIEVSEGE